MKQLSAIFIIFWCQLISYSQSVVEEIFPTKEGRIFYQEVVSVDSTIIADDLYLAAKTWITENFVSGKSVLQTEDKEGGLLIIKAYFKENYDNLLNPEIWFTLKIETKIGRYRYSLYDIRFVYSASSGGYTNNVDKPLEDWLDISDPKISASKRERLYNKSIAFCTEIDIHLTNTIKSLKKNMNVVTVEW